jgi:hypothetical protein
MGSCPSTLTADNESFWPRLRFGTCYSYPPVISRLGLVLEEVTERFKAGLVSLYLPSIQKCLAFRYVFMYIIGITSTLAPYPSASSFLAYITQITPQIPYLFRDKTWNDGVGRWSDD